jgi:hypothetical protein
MINPNILPKPKIDVEKFNLLLDKKLNSKDVPKEDIQLLKIVVEKLEEEKDVIEYLAIKYGYTTKQVKLIVHSPFRLLLKMIEEVSIRPFDFRFLGIFKIKKKRIENENIPIQEETSIFEADRKNLLGKSLQDLKLKVDMYSRNKPNYKNPNE